MNQTHVAKAIARSLLDIGAIHLSPNKGYTWASGIKAPIYCDNRLTISYPPVRNQIAEGFCDLIREIAPQVEVIAGTSTAGIPHAAWIADKLKLPMVYIRDKAKVHGRGNQIEGLLHEGQKVVVVEDLISTGGSSLKAAQAVIEAGGHVLATCAIFTYEFTQAIQSFAQAKIPLYTLSNFSALCDVALSMGKITEEDLGTIEKWREQFTNPIS